MSRESAERGLVYNIDHPTAGKVPVIASPVRLLGTPGPAPSPPPLLGEHTAAILGEQLGYSEQAIADLAASGVIAVASPGDGAA